MGKRFEALSEAHRDFIEAQQMFFVATAAADGRINLSPKGLDTLRVLGSNRVLWLNLTGSGNETATHLARDGRITLMFCAFNGAPEILRVYGRGRAVHPRDRDWEKYLDAFEPMLGARQVIDVAVELVQTSCGFAVPLYEYRGQRHVLDNWAEKKGREGITQYWRERNAESLDGWPTGIAE